jgi:hypothetical protein
MRVTRPITGGISANKTEVDLMHVLHRPQLPRLIGVSVFAAILAILISLVIATSVNNINQPGGNSIAAVRHTAPTAMSALQSAIPRWVRNPFSRLSSQPLPQSWLTRP